MDFGDKVVLRTEVRSNKRRNKRQGLKKLLGILFLFFLFATAIILFFLSDFFAVKQIRVTGADRFGESDFTPFFQEYVGENGFRLLMRHGSVKTLDKTLAGRLADTEQQMLFAFPYLKDVQVRYDFPSTLSVTVAERNAVLFLNDYDDYICIDSTGCVIDIMSEAEFSSFREQDRLGTSFVRGVEIGEYSLGRAVSTGENKKLDNVIKLCAAINENRVLAGKIESIDVSVEGEIYLYAPPSLVVSFGGFDKMYERVLKLSGAFSAGYDGNANGMIVFSDDGFDVFRPNAVPEDPGDPEAPGSGEGENPGPPENPGETPVPTEPPAPAPTEPPEPAETPTPTEPPVLPEQTPADATEPGSGNVGNGDSILDFDGAP